MHLPQTEEARAEASALMNVATNICTPRNGEPLVAATQDFVTASFLVTQRDVFFDRDAFCALAAYVGDALERVELFCGASSTKVLRRGQSSRCLARHASTLDPSCLSWASSSTLAPNRLACARQDDNCAAVTPDSSSSPDSSFFTTASLSSLSESLFVVTHNRSSVVASRLSFRLTSLELCNQAPACLEAVLRGRNWIVQSIANDSP